MNIENTTLWKNAFSIRENDPDRECREKLRGAYSSFWQNATTLSREIQKTLPTLTLHDDKHFEALWHCADLIIGNSVELTPLEVFVFGGAVLIHDAANCIAAYEGGLDELRNTPEWSDAKADVEARHVKAKDSITSEQLQQEILLEALRHLHAVKAESLCSMKVVVGDESFHLIQDDQLRTHIGDLIGHVAASHHWDVEELPKRLQSNFGALVGFSRDWTVRPVLLAGLIRCADAIQLDQSRAPDFLYGLLQLKGVSELHWRAQNRLAAPMVDPEDASSLLFTSTKPFFEQDSEAWWIAYEAISMANKELVRTDALLKDLKLPSFEINRLSHANSPQRLGQHVRISGWEPVKATIHVSNVDGIVDMFGGDKLYGQAPHVALRELIQNAADAVRLRRTIERPKSSYKGSIVVSTETVEGHPDEIWLHVEDDGIGMSRDVITGPLLDFGASYLSSTLVKKERPGLVGKKVTRSGKYGIGFFSVFMLGLHVEVISRPFDQGLASTKTLVFKNGYKQQPILKSGASQGFGSVSSTRVSVKLALGKWSELLEVRSFSSEGKTIQFGSLVSCLAPMLDVDVYVRTNEGLQELVHCQNWAQQDAKSWLNSIVLIPEGGLTRQETDAIDFASEAIELIDPENPKLGRASIPANVSIGVRTVDGLIAHNGLGAHNVGFDGAIEYYSTGPLRLGSDIVAFEKLAIWASRQAQFLATKNLNDQQKFIAAGRVVRFGGDASPIAVMNLNSYTVPLKEIYEYLLAGNVLFAPVKRDHREEEIHLITRVRERHWGLLDTYSKDELEYLVDVLEPVTENSDCDDYLAITTDKNEVKLGFLNFLINYAQSNQQLIKGEFVAGVEFAKYVGEPSHRDGLHYGKLIKTNGLKLWINQ